EADLERAEARAKAAEDAANMVSRLRSELDGIEALRPAGSLGSRLGEVLTARKGYEAALSSVLGALVDAIVGSAEEPALDVARRADGQVTVLFPSPAPEPLVGSLYPHVDVRDGYDGIARRLLGQVVVGTDVTVDGVYREAGLVRAG